MSNENKPTLKIDNTEYQYESLTENQKIMINHCLDLDRKISATEFQLQQLQVGKLAFSNMLKQTFEPVPAPEPVPEPVPVL